MAYRRALAWQVPQQNPPFFAPVLAAPLIFAEGGSTPVVQRNADRALAWRQAPLPLLLSLLLCGCAVLPSVRNTLAPKPKDLVAVPLTLRWDYPTNELDRVYFEFYTAHNLGEPWTLFCRVTNALEYPFSPSDQGFFWGVAVDKSSGLVSPPNH